LDMPAPWKLLEIFPRRWKRHGTAPTAIRRATPCEHRHPLLYPRSGWPRLAMVAAAPVTITAMDPACWPPAMGYSHAICCHPYEKGGRSECWVDGFTFERCCVPEARTTISIPLRVPATVRAYDLAGRLYGSEVVHSPAHLSMVGGDTLLVSWRASWACPPGPPTMSRGACVSHPDFMGELWLVVYVLQTTVAEYAQTSPHNSTVSPLLAGGLRLAATFAELRCVLLYWSCASEGWTSDDVLAELCAFLDLVLIELVALGVVALSPFVEGVGGTGSGFCGAWRMRGDNPQWLTHLVEASTKELLDYIEAQGLPRWREAGSSHLNGDVSAARTGRALLVHPSLPVEFAPSCAALLHLQGSGPRFMGAGHAPSVGVTGGLSWHLGIRLVMGALNVRRDPIVVNLGAEDGGCHQHVLDSFWMYDPANCLIESDGWGGVLVEGNATTFELMRNRMSGRSNVLCSHAYIEPGTALRTLLQAEPCGKAAVGASGRIKSRIAAGDVDLLKIDLDFGDCDFAEALLAGGHGLRPLVVHVEVNPFFPPPVAYRQRFSRSLLRSHGEPGDFILRLQNQEWRPWRIGCSLSAYHEALGGHDAYALAQLEFDNALFVRRDLADRLPLAGGVGAGPALLARDHWLQGFYCDPLRWIIRRDDEYAGFDFRRWAYSCVPPDGSEPVRADLDEALASMRALLARDGAREVGSDLLGAPPGTFPFSLSLQALKNGGG